MTFAKYTVALYTLGVYSCFMKTVNALTIRNKFGEVLSYLEETHEPVLVSKGKRVRAALVPIEEFERRFLDKRSEEKRQEFLERVREATGSRRGDRDSLEVLRELREGGG
jgi:prevent-host-death family protein